MDWSYTTYPDSAIHRIGLHMNTTCDGVKLEIERKTDGSADIHCYMFVVADVLMEVMNSNLKSILYWR